MALGSKLDMMNVLTANHKLVFFLPILLLKKTWYRDAGRQPHKDATSSHWPNSRQPRTAAENHVA